MPFSLGLGLLIALVAGNSQADCDCLWEGTFTEVQHQTQLVISATVLGSKGNSIDVHINRRLRGQHHAQTARVWLKTANYCRPEVTEFPIDSQWVLALYRIKEDVPGGFNPNTPNVSYGRVGDYYLSSCGGYWLSQHEGRVAGNLVNAPRWVREPKMTPVLVDLVADFISGRVDVSTLVKASKEDPALRELKLNTRAFLREEQ